MKPRRALSVPRTAGRLRTDGDRAQGDWLADALRAAQTDATTSDSLTHPVHTYPARMHPATARILVSHLTANTSTDAVVLDPFCGSGTSLVEARSAGASALGVDLSPLAALLARTKATPLPQSQYKHIRLTAHRIAGEVQELGKAARRASSEPEPWWNPVGVDAAARGRKLSRWFAPHVRRELEAIARRIEVQRGVSGDDVANCLLVALSAILIKASSRTSDTNSKWIDKTIGRGAPTRWFVERVEMLLAGLAEIPRGGSTETLIGDARELPRLLPPAAAYCIVTSPPYAGTYDYVDHHRLRFDFFGLSLHELRHGEMGARRHAASELRRPKRGAPPADPWILQLGAMLRSCAHALAPGGLAAFVIGDSRTETRAHFAMDDLRAAMPSTWDYVASASQERPVWGREADMFGDRGKAEHIILLRRNRA